MGHLGASWAGRESRGPLGERAGRSEPLPLSRPLSRSCVSLTLCSLYSTGLPHAQAGATGHSDHLQPVSLASVLTGLLASAHTSFQVWNWQEGSPVLATLRPLPAGAELGLGQEWSPALGITGSP